MKTAVLSCIGFLLLALGAIGLLLPVWPTTPFVLAAAGCFSGTPRLRAGLMRNRFFREHIENYSARTGLSAKTVAISLCYLWGMLLLSLLLTRTLWAGILLSAVGVTVTAHILHVSKPRRKGGDGL